jgi:hypothetical protein
MRIPMISFPKSEIFSILRIELQEFEHISASKHHGWGILIKELLSLMDKQVCDRFFLLNESLYFK